jgi:two-component system KDP operon response regulator KdpE
VAAARILLVDSDPQVLRAIRTFLLAESYEPQEARGEREVVDHVESGHCDLVLMDMNAPGVSGMGTCREIRMRSSVPIIVMSGRDNEKDRIEALDAGADDYVAKPFAMREMLARIRANLRRTLASEAPPANLLLGDVEIDFAMRRVRTHAGEERLTLKEYNLLSYLAAHPNRPIPHGELLRAVWGPANELEHEYLRVFVNRLRKKIEPSPKRPTYLLTEPWVGYRLVLAGE